jgi:hypothetical protein
MKPDGYCAEARSSIPHPIVRSAQRFPNYPDNRLNEYGFRVERIWRFTETAAAIAD